MSAPLKVTKFTQMNKEADKKVEPKILLTQFLPIYTADLSLFVITLLVSHKASKW